MRRKAGFEGVMIIGGLVIAGVFAIKGVKMIEGMGLILAGIGFCISFVLADIERRLEE